MSSTKKDWRTSRLQWTARKIEQARRDLLIIKERKISRDHLNEWNWTECYLTPAPPQSPVSCTLDPGGLKPEAVLGSALHLWALINAIPLIVCLSHTLLFLFNTLSFKYNIRLKQSSTSVISTLRTSYLSYLLQILTNKTHQLFMLSMNYGAVWGKTN